MVVVLSDSPRISSGVQAFSVGGGIVESLPLVPSDKTGSLDFVQEVTTSTSLLFFKHLILYYFIHFVKLCTGSLSATNGVLCFLSFLFFCNLFNQGLFCRNL